MPTCDPIICNAVKGFIACSLLPQGSLLPGTMHAILLYRGLCMQYCYTRDYACNIATPGTMHAIRDCAGVSSRFIILCTHLASTSHPCMQDCSTRDYARVKGHSFAKIFHVGYLYKHVRLLHQGLCWGHRAYN